MERTGLAFDGFFDVVQTTDAAQAATVTLAPGQSTGGPDNCHRGSDQWLFVVSGAGRATVDGREVRLESRDLVRTEAGETPRDRDRRRRSPGDAERLRPARTLTPESRRRPGIRRRFRAPSPALFPSGPVSRRMAAWETNSVPGVEGETLARRGAVATLASVIVNLAVTTAALSAGIGTDLRALSYGSVGVLTVVGVVGAVVVYALLRRSCRDPDLWFTVVAAAVLVVSVIPDFTHVPTEPGGTVVAGLVLASMHVLTAVVCVVVLTGRLPGDL